DRGDFFSGGDDPSPERDRRVDPAQIGDSHRMSAVFVSVRKEVEKVAGSLQVVLAEQASPSGANSFEELDRRVGNDSRFHSRAHEVIVPRKFVRGETARDAARVLPRPAKRGEGGAPIRRDL